MKKNDKFYQIISAKCEVKKGYQKITICVDATFRNLMRENSKLRQEIKNLNRTIASLRKEKKHVLHCSASISKHAPPKTDSCEKNWQVS